MLELLACLLLLSSVLTQGDMHMGAAWQSVQMWCSRHGTALPVTCGAWGIEPVRHLQA